MRFMLDFFRAHPSRTLITLLALLLAGLVEGIGLSALLPLLSVATHDESLLNLPGIDPVQRNAFEQHIIDLLAYFGLSPTLGTLLLIVLFGITLRNILLFITRRQVGNTGAQVITDLRLDLLRALLRCRWSYFVHQPVGKLTNALATEASRSSEAFVAGAEAITFLVQGLVYGAVAFAVDWRATLVALVIGSITVFILHSLVRMAKKAGRKQTDLLNVLMAKLTDTLQSVKPLKAMAKEYLASTALAATTQRLNKALRKKVMSKALLNSTQDEMFALLIVAGVFVALIYFDMAFATVVMLAIVIGRMLSFFGKVQKQHQQMALGESAYWSLRQTIADSCQAEESSHGELSPRLTQAIECRHVTFAYDNHPILKDVTLCCPAGQLTTLIGPSGAGKTTVIDLIIGLIQPQTGSVTIDDQAVDQLDIQAWRTMIGYVPQENVLLHDTIVHNVTLSDPAFTEDDAKRALQAAGAWEFITAMADGLHSIVGERGSRLSGGQRQRIMIARALIHQPRLLILDEATSALDPASEAAVRDTIQQLRGHYTIIAISHQPNLVDAADRVYKLDNGKAIRVK